MRLETIKARAIRCGIPAADVKDMDVRNIGKLRERCREAFPEALRYCTLEATTDDRGHWIVIEAPARPGVVVMPDKLGALAAPKPSRSIAGRVVYLYLWHNKHSEDWPEHKPFATKASALAEARGNLQDTEQDAAEVRRAMSELEKTGEAGDLFAEGYMAIKRLHIGA